MYKFTSRLRAFAVQSMIVFGSIFAENKLIIISPHHEGIEREYTWAFQEWYRRQYRQEVELEWLDQGGTSDDIRFIRSEFAQKPAGIGVDIFWGGGTDPYLEFAELGLLSPYPLPPDQLAALPPTIYGVPMYSPGYEWYGTALSGFGILRNKVVVGRLKLPAVRTWEDLTHPRLQSWVGGADPRSSGSAHMCYEIILQAYGWEKGWQILTLIGANVKAFSKGSNQAPKDVAVGEVAYGLVIDLYAWTQIEEVGRDRLDYVLPEGLTVINPDAIGILKGAPHLDVARKFLEFVLSPAGQRLLILPPGHPPGPREFLLGRMPVLPALYQEQEKSVIKINPFAYTKSFAYDSPTGSSRWGLLNDLIGVLLIDTHQELVRAWKRIIKHGCREEHILQLIQMPHTEAEIMEMAPKWKDQTFRNRTIAHWTSFAQQKYRKIIKELK